MKERILKILKNSPPLTQAELRKKLPRINRAVLLGYLRALSDLKVIKSKRTGRAIIYYV